MRNSLPLLAMALPACLWAGTAAMAQPSPDDAAGWLAERNRALSQFGAVLPPPTAEETGDDRGLALVADSAPQVAASDVRLALTQMALAAGSAGQAEIAAAQPTRGPGAIYLRAGAATLTELFEATRGTDLESVLTRDGQRFVASRPIVVVQGATLQLEPGDVLTLEANDGAFLLSFGHVEMAGATVRADPAPYWTEESFRPFVAILGTGTLDASWSVFAGLGSDVAPFASGLSLGSGSLFAATRSSGVRDSRFIDTHGLSIIGSDGARVVGNRFDGAEGIAISVDDSDRVEIRDNVIVEPEGRFAIRVDGPATDVEATNNIMVGGHHDALRVAAGASAVDLYGNVIADFAGSAIIADEGTRCLRLAGNLIRGNGGDGLGAGDIGDVIVTANIIQDNGGAGISLSRSRPEAELIVAGNLFERNRSGVRTASIGSLTLTDNDLARQLPRHLAGDLSQHTPLFLHEIRGGHRAALLFDHVKAGVADPLTPDAVAAAFTECRAEAGS
ncbi:right-handed parallel beta-helix repeat-containing protein [Rubellimicrobium rubrum]|uniref:right-handed parallel beta-helix repeat-containing protein n=1 Tax=Rubellimicrobium rubrum TaxID=2585369 RepID=UPI00159BEF39|nr:right-handed parallel beta-helix repeat-containing protein [Rubellimicrobium rubrum]